MPTRTICARRRRLSGGQETRCSASRRGAAGSGGGAGLYCRDYPDVAAELEDEVVQVGCCHGPQGGELGGCLRVVEYVERPVAGGATAQVRVVERGAPGGLRPHAGSGDLSGAQQQVLVDLIERTARVRVDERDGLAEQLFLLAAGAGPAMGAVAQVGEMAQQGAGGVCGRYWPRRA